MGLMGHVLAQGLGPIAGDGAGDFAPVGTGLVPIQEEGLLGPRHAAR